MNQIDFYRPKWSCGRYYRDASKSHALMYNLIEGMVYYFQDESADIIGKILEFPKTGQLPLQALCETTGNQYSHEEIQSFCNDLVDVGLLTQGLLSEDVIIENRKIAGEQRSGVAMNVEKTILEKLPFLQDSAENIYMDILEKARIPFVVMFELTYSCNEKCVHCFNPGAARNDSEKSERNNREEIDLHHYEMLLDELQKMGVVKIILTGGDPFVKKDIWKLIELIYEKDFVFDIYTNGLGLIGKTKRLANFYPRSVGLSVYSAEEYIHDSITRVKGSLAKTLQVAGDLMMMGVPLYFKCPIMKLNATSYFMVVELAKQYGAIPQLDITLTDSVDGDNSITEQLQVDGELLEIILRDPNIPLYVGKEAPNYGSQERDKSQAFCGAGTVMMNVTPEGDITPCNSFPTQFGNLKNQSFTDIWESSLSLRNWQTIVIDDYEECGTHERCSYCNRCPGQSFIEHGTPLKASSSNCYTANVRMGLAKKLKTGLDPLNGKSVEEVLSSFNGITDTIKVVSNKTEKNFRNTELVVNKKANS
jgi:radical SAM protein with 4Fe4S-binding SPASM domain